MDWIQLSKALVDFNKLTLTQTKKYCENNNLNLGKLALPLRAATTGKSVSPGLYELMEVLGKAETLARIIDINK